MGTQSERRMADARPRAHAMLATKAPTASRLPILWPYQTSAVDDADTAYPFDPREYLYESYVERRRLSSALRLYYALRPLIPRRLQLALRRACVPIQRSRSFPAWPIEPLLVVAQY